MAAEIQPSCISKFALPVTNLHCFCAPLESPGTVFEFPPVWSQYSMLSNQTSPLHVTYLELNFMRRTAGLTYLHLSPISLPKNKWERKQSIATCPPSVCHATHHTSKPQRKQWQLYRPPTLFNVSAAIRRSLVNSPTVRLHQQESKINK